MSSSGESYSRFGSENPLTPASIDPTQFCVGNIFFTPQGIDGSRLDKELCPLFMGQRCAQNWDDACSAYLTGSNYDQGGFLHINKKFLTEAAKKKYCRMSSAPGTHCAKRCESFIPEGQSSVQVCDTWGTMNWLDTQNEQDLGGNFPQSARLNPISPLYMSYCPEVCDASDTMSADALGPNDTVLNYCIQYGTCEQVLMDLAYNLAANNQESRVTNPAFQKITAAAKLDAPINPNVVAKIATSYGLPIDTAMEVLKGAKEGGVSGNVKSDVFSIIQAPGSGKVEIPGSTPVASSTMVSMPPGKNSSNSQMKIPVSPTVVKGVVSPTKSSKPSRKGKEGFYKQSVNGKTIIGASVAFIVIILLIWGIKSKR